MRLDELVELARHEVVGDRDVAERVAEHEVVALALGSVPESGPGVVLDDLDAGRVAQAELVAVDLHDLRVDLGDERVALVVALEPAREGEGAAADRERLQRPVALVLGVDDLAVQPLVGIDELGRVLDRHDPVDEDVERKLLVGCRCRPCRPGCSSSRSRRVHGTS